tara:strand:+ start:838 stop:1005 length:168 start_codon:yes stop_codon:yes gene_type:complete
MNNPLEIAEQIRRLNEEGLNELCHILSNDNMADKMSSALNVIHIERSIQEGNINE